MKIGNFLRLEKFKFQFSFYHFFLKINFTFREFLVSEKSRKILGMKEEFFSVCSFIWTESLSGPGNVIKLNGNPVSRIFSVFQMQGYLAFCEKSNDLSTSSKHEYKNAKALRKSPRHPRIQHFFDKHLVWSLDNDFLKW